MRLRYKIGYIVLLGSLITGLIYRDVISYGIHLGAGEFRLLFNSVPISEMLEDPDFPEGKKEQLRLVQEIREFSIDSLGLSDSKSYRRLYDQQGEPVLWVVTAAKPFKLESYKWSYPLLGQLGYKGFFDKNKALQEEMNLNKRGFDTELSTVNAWSTLGFFADPILSDMLDRSPGGLARLIIHELTHGTLYAKGDDAFSENLATFVGDNGAVRFMKYKYGAQSDELKQYLDALGDIRKYSLHMMQGALRLDSLYASFSGAGKTMEEKKELKERMIRSILAGSASVGFSNPENYSYLLADDFKPNNTYFISFRRYRERQREFQEKFDAEFGKDFPAYLKFLRKM